MQSISFVILCVSLILFSLITVLLFKNTYLSKKTTLETFTVSTVQYENLSEYNSNLLNSPSSSVCENADNDIYNKLKVVLTDTNYTILSEKIDTHTTNPQLIASTSSKCVKLKELFCDSNYQKIKHFINIGLHDDGNNVWNIEDTAQSNADNCDKNTLNSNIICANMSNLLDNFHIIKHGIIDCDPPNPSTRSYRSFDLNCSAPMSNCSVGQKLNSNVVDVTTRFNIGTDDNACVACSLGQITDTPYSCSNCVNLKPNDDKNGCVGCVDEDYDNQIGSCSWNCDQSRPTRYFTSSLEFCTGSRVKPCSDPCTDLEANGVIVRLKIQCTAKTDVWKYLTKKTANNNQHHVGLEDKWSNYPSETYCGQRWKLNFDTGLKGFNIQYIDDDTICGDSGYNNYYLNFDTDASTCYGSKESENWDQMYCGILSLKSDKDHDHRKFEAHDRWNTSSLDRNWVLVNTGEFYYFKNKDGKFIKFEFSSMKQFYLSSVSDVSYASAIQIERP